MTEEPYIAAEFKVLRQDLERDTTTFSFRFTFPPNGTPENPLRLCEHGFHHPLPDNLDYPHSCDGCWCEGLRDQRDYGWNHDTTPKENHE
jgi:hypothetical protein